MNKLQILQLALAAICHLVIVEASLKTITCALGNWSVCSRSKTRYYYDGINNYLKANVKSEDVNVIQEIIGEWIKRESSHDLTPKEAERLRALILLHSLVQTDGIGTCNLSSSRILQNNDQAVGGAISKLSPGEIPKRKIERLINYYASQYLRDCDHEKKVKEVSSTSMEYVSRIIGEYINVRAKEDAFTFFQAGVQGKQSFVTSSPYIASNFVKSLKEIRQSDPAIIHRLLLELATEKFDANVRYLSKNQQSDLEDGKVNGNAIFRTYRKYVGKPCEEFVEKVESSFGSPWALEQSKKIHKRLNTEEPLYINLSYYYGCNLMLHSEEEILDGLKKLIAQQ